MNGKFQGQNQLLINAPKEKIWDVLINGEVLSQWMPIVKHTTSKTECLNAERSCDVELNGKKGKVMEKCVLFNEGHEIGWEMVNDEFGFDKMFANYGFSFELIPISGSTTKVINRGFGDPRNWIAKTMNVLMLRRKSAGIRKTALNGIKKLAETS